MFVHVETISVIYCILGGFILLYGLCSLVVKERLYISEAMVAVTIGVIFGPACANFINIGEWGGDQVELTRQFSRLTIGIQVMAAGVCLPKAYLRKELRSMTIMLLPVMITMWLVSGLCVWAMIPNLDYLQSLMIAACFTPTDPILANSIVQGKFAERRVPLNVRNLILAESGANDGLGFPFLYLAIYLIQMPAGEAIGQWAYYILAYEILLSIIIGFVAGYIARKLLKTAEKRKLIDKESFLVYAVALSLFLMGTVSMVGSDDLLACFIAGNSFTWDDWFRKETVDAHMSEVIDLLLNLTMFVYIGATMPWSSFENVELQLTVWRLIVLAILVLLFRRLPIVVALYKVVPALRTWREALFCGWFGPIGVGALFYYTEAVDNFPVDGPQAHARSVVEPVVYFLILSSVIVHGITIPLFHIGTFASRTLTRTSVSSSSNGTIQVLRLPRFRSISQETSHQQYYPSSSLDQKDTTPAIDSRDDTVTSPEPALTATPPRQTAITIVIPDQHQHHQNNVVERTDDNKNTKSTEQQQQKRQQLIDDEDDVDDDII
ncbi:Sodium/hydrogen exchanger family-domain-containing protein [Halteromyces radiatus]|uniref:Sodium/hydrogen exchanger family-domain-containing protein n=1 Tax=Halteromyces radiatus TaxID=101107 RepID=UPI00221FA19E|nr:Sodium/hydrogen exchanger family-domain-containing protein [Halteromyces radiatus]KAI8084881.1 Sodium/hydrogen exchanger family-domain-containing protein [Halteromyces radiatus]